jgi:hypothetical protein
LLTYLFIDANLAQVMIIDFRVALQLLFQLFEGVPMKILIESRE